MLPDQRGQGLSGGSRSDFEMGQFVTNIVDAAVWAKEKYAGPLFMAGASLGGALTYKAAAAGAPVQAIICHNLYDFGDPQNTLAVSKFAPLAGVPGIAALSAKTTRLLAALAPGLRLPYMMLGKFDKMVDERNKDFYPLYRRDPYPIRWITLRYLASTFNTAPVIPLEKNTLPVLVINQTLDRMVDPAVTRGNYDRLGGEKKYVEIEYGHWAMGHGFEAEWVKIVDDFLRPLIGAPQSSLSPGGRMSLHNN
ncbi:MAG: alpha/beta fold hydrolase [Ardenticatenaceae bacterium]|nr:alpha/beta fold hydrolase [Ardenticatenaceae bacterium]